MGRPTRPGLVATEHNRWQTHRVPTRLLNRVTGRWDDVDFAVTEEVRRSMRGASGHRAVTLRHGIDIADVSEALAQRESVRAELGLGADDFVIGTVANFRAQKDYPNLLHAARLVTECGLPIRVVAVGQGPQEAEIRALHEQLGLGDRVVLTGFRRDAVRVMAGCDAFTLASQWEGLPVAVMEASALGLPIVATAVGGIAEEFTDAADALLVPPRDSVALAAAWERVATESSFRARLAAASLERAPDFSVSRTVAEIEAAYGRLASVVASEPVVDVVPTAHVDRARQSSLDIRPATIDDRPEIIALLERSLGGGGDARYPRLFAWKHDENRFGQSPMWLATDSGRIVAFRAFMRWEFVRGGTVVRAVRAVDTATDPDHRGRGIFRALTMHGLEHMRSEGVDFVFNTPNTQSRPGYLEMGWREVGRLPAAVHFAGVEGAVAAFRSRVPADRWSQDLTIGVPVGEWLAGGGPHGRWPVPTDVREIRTNMDAGYLAWRFDTTLLGYRVVDDGDAAIICRSRLRGSALELAVVASFGRDRAADGLIARAARETRSSYAIRLGQPRLSSPFVLPLPGGGPVLTWRAVNDPGEPPLSNWALTLGDIELF